VKTRRRLPLTWLDGLVVAATVLTFAAVVSATVGRG
jgi:predicted transcriptional regulator